MRLLSTYIQEGARHKNSDRNALLASRIVSLPVLPRPGRHAARVTAVGVGAPLASAEGVLREAAYRRNPFLQAGPKSVQTSTVFSHNKVHATITMA